VLPVLVSLASKPDQNVPTVVEGALDLANALLTPSTPQAAAEVHALFSATVMGLLRTQDDPGILQSCCEYLRRTLCFDEQPGVFCWKPRLQDSTWLHAAVMQHWC
jgi:hypothetical protein